MQGATPLIQDRGRQREQAQELMFFFSCIAGMGSVRDTPDLVSKSTTKLIPITRIRSKIFASQIRG